jgi:hypothetical protein
MTKRSKKNQKSQTKLKDFVTVTFVEDMEQAREYETLLRVNDIPTIIREQHDPSLATRSVAIMVPEDCLDEAHVVIESQDAYDDFYDFALEDETDIEAELDDNFFEDEF